MTAYIHHVIGTGLNARQICVACIPSDLNQPYLRQSTTILITNISLLTICMECVHQRWINVEMSMHPLADCNLLMALKPPKIKQRQAYRHNVSPEGT